MLFLENADATELASTLQSLTQSVEEQREETAAVETARRELRATFKTKMADLMKRGKEQADAIAGQFCASVIGIVYYWLANPDDLAGTGELHSNLKRSMSLLLTAPRGT